MDIKNIINKKRNKQELTDEEIRYFIQKYAKGEVLEAQAGALLSYIYLNGLTDREILNLSLAMANSDNDSPFDFVKDTKAMPDEAAEITEMGRMIKEAIATLPQKDRTIVEYRFYRNMQVKEIARQVGLSSSRITRIVQAALNTVREYLEAHDQHDF